MYKIISISIVLLFSLYASLFAMESIDTQIAALQQALPAERVKLMNAIKVQLSQMNKSERRAAIDQLRQKRGAVGTKGQDVAHTSAQHQKQMGTMEQVGRHEQMNQRQGLEQYHHSQGSDHGQGSGRVPNSQNLNTQH
ncbi:MAG: hypothetical protein DRG24_03365 [Epsilonproteobacteria bacterium]|nr:MAG: hypothetical protein DRG24_03365 [Campylobacterota bacterium]